MIDLGRAPLERSGVVVFADHADPGLFYYLPSRPRLRVGEGRRPELKLVRYRLPPDQEALIGGGLLSLTVDLSVPEATLESVRAALHRAEGREVRLAPAQAEDGTCRLVLLDAAPGAGSSLVHHVYGEARPALFGSNAATFLAVLSPEATALVEAALGDGGLPACVAYDLTVLALQPTLRARIWARWVDLYDFFEARLHGGQVLVAVDVGPTIEELVHDEILHVEVDQLVPEDERAATFQQAVERAQRYVLEEFFEPVLGQQPPAEDDGGLLGDLHTIVGGLLGAFTLTHSLRKVERHEDRRFDFHLNAASAARIHLAPQGLLSDLLRPGPEEPPLDRRGLISTLDAGVDPELRFDLGCLVDLEKEGVDRLELRLRHGAREERVTLDAANPRGTFITWLDPQDRDEIHYAYTAFFRGGSDGLPASLDGPERPTRSRVIRLDPRELYQRADLRILARGMPWDRYPSVLVDLRARPGGAEQTLELTEQAPSAGWAIRGPQGVELRPQARLRYVDPAGREEIGDWDPVEGGVLIVGDPAPAILDVQLLGAARFGTHVARVIVELRLPSRPEEVSSRVLDAATPFTTWSARLADPSDRRWEYRVTLHTVNNEAREGEWQPGEGARLQVGESLWQVRSVELVFVGQTLIGAGLMGIKVRFSYDDPDHQIHEEEETLVRDASKVVAWRYPIADPERRAYTVQLTHIRLDGAQEILPPTLTSDKLVVVTLEAP